MKWKGPSFYPKILFTAATALFVLFIFHNSMFPGPQSGAQSQTVMHFVNQLLASCNIPYAFTEHFIRKAGHFTEYFIFGVLLALTLRAYRCEGLEFVFAQGFFLLLVPACDELIQLFTPERGSSVADIFLDFCGGVVGTVVCCLFLFRSAKKRRSVHRFGR